MERLLNVVMLLGNPDKNDSRVLREAEALSAAGHRITVISQLKKGSNIPSQERVNGVDFRRFRFSGKILRRKGLWAYFTFGRPVEQLVKSIAPDVIHAHDLIALPTAVDLGRRLGAKTIYDSHEYHTGLAADVSAIKSRFIAWLERRYIGRADSVITVNEDIADRLEAKYGIQRPTVVLNSVLRPIENENTTDSDIRREVGIGQDVPLAVYVGARQRFRGLENLIDALPTASDVHCAMVGPAAIQFDQLLRDKADSLGCASRVHLLPAVPHDTVTRYISTADFGILPFHDPRPNQQTALPTKLFECLFAGIPVICSDLPGMTKFVNTEGVGILVDARDPEEIAAGLIEMSTNIDRYTMDSEALERLDDRYGWKRQSEILTELYRSLYSEQRHVA